MVVIAATQTEVMLAVSMAKTLNLGRQENVFDLIYVIQVRNVGPMYYRVNFVWKTITVTMVNAKQTVTTVIASALPEKQNILAMIIFLIFMIGTCTSCTTVFLLINLVDA